LRMLRTTYNSYVVERNELRNACESSYSGCPFDAVGSERSVQIGKSMFQSSVRSVDANSIYQI
jgi:hypothetical protein